ncbi:hypothetical protein [Bradyrhizobium sp. URHD0069]|uniref:hypothetical protein n=1 Tax=Bradyrhizobium sp. URHD0069 TaxID=1380355 RepID=UPI003527E691
MGEQFSAYLVPAHQKLAKGDYQRIGFTDSFGRSHWAPRQDILRALPYIREECDRLAKPPPLARHAPDQGWKRQFDEPIALPAGLALITLRDAPTYITELPKKEAAEPEWQAAIEALMLVVELGRPTMFARIGVMRALNRGHVRAFNPSRKDPHWGRRKLARDR